MWRWWSGGWAPPSPDMLEGVLVVIGIIVLIFIFGPDITGGPYGGPPIGPEIKK